VSNSETYYCAICEVELKENELLDNCCPYCGTEVPEAAERQVERRES